MQTLINDLIRIYDYKHEIRLSYNYVERDLIDIHQQKPPCGNEGENLQDIHYELLKSIQKHLKAYHKEFHSLTAIIQHIKAFDFPTTAPIKQTQLYCNIFVAYNYALRDLLEQP